jgi:3'-5' exonuclease
MDIVTADMECFYDSEYTLSKMTTEAYLRDPRFSEIMWGIKFNDAPAFWLLPDRADHFFKNEVDWANTALIHHHAHFDGAALNWHHGVRPAMFIDTLSMARVLDGPKAGNSLHDLCERHGIGAKGNYVTYAKGKHLADFTNAELQEYGQYCCTDCDRTYDLAQIFLPQMPGDELRMIDRVIRCFTEPTLIGDVGQLRNAVASEVSRKADLLQRLGLICKRCGGNGDDPAKDMIEGTVICKDCGGSGVDKKTIGSNEKLAALFRAAGVEPETKTSPTTGEQIYAFARTDSAMQELLEDEYEGVRFLAETRIAIKSNIVETRAKRYADSASRGPMPVYISYAAAHTFRVGGGDSMNWLNISSKHNENRPELSIVAASISAPPGHKIVVADSGQGEARITAWNARQLDLVTAFANGDDVYSAHASTIYGRPVDRKRVKEDHIPGQLGKVSILGMGFGMGWYKASMELLKGMLGAPPIQFVMADLETLQVDPSRFLNNPKKIAMVNEMPSRLELNDRLIHCIVTEALVLRYRARYLEIPKYWSKMEEVINAMMRGEEMVFGANDCMRTGKECIWMPNGLAMHYKGLERDQNTGDATYFDGRKRTKIHGPLLTENTTQCLHYIIVREQLLNIAEVLKVVLTTYDDVVCVVPDEAANDALAFMVQEMSKTPGWATGLPLIGEGKISNTLKGAS